MKLSEETISQLVDALEKAKSYEDLMARMDQLKRF